MLLSTAINTLYSAPLKSQNENDRNCKIDALRAIDEQLMLTTIQNGLDFDKLLSSSIRCLLRILQDSDLGVWPIAEQILIRMIKTLGRNQLSLSPIYHELIVNEILKCMMTKGLGGRSRRFSIELLFSIAHQIQMQNTDAFLTTLLETLLSIVKMNDDVLLQEALSKFIEPIAQHQLVRIHLPRINLLLDSLISNISSIHSSVRKSAVTCLVVICKYHPQRYQIFEHVTRKLFDIIQNYHYHNDIISPPSTTNNGKETSLSEEVTSQQQVQPIIEEATSLDKGLALPVDPMDQFKCPKIDDMTESTSNNLPLISRRNGDEHAFSLCIQPSLQNVPSSALEGIFHCLKQLIRLSYQLSTHSNPHLPSQIPFNVMNPDLVFITRLAISALSFDNNNAVVTSLELIQELLQHHGFLFSFIMLNMENQTLKCKLEANALLQALLREFHRLLSQSDMRISILVLVVICLSSLVAKPSQLVQQFTKMHFGQLMALHKHKYPLLRGQVHYFLGCFVSGWLQCPSKIEWPDLNILELVDTILIDTIEDNSSITSKMACDGLKLCIEPLLLSEYAFHIPYMLRKLIGMKRNASILLNSKLFSVIRKVDYRILKYLGHSMNVSKIDNPHQSATSITSRNQTNLPNQLQAWALDLVISFLEDPEMRIRNKAALTLVKLISKLHYLPFLQQFKQKAYDTALRIVELQIFDRNHHLINKMCLDNIYSIFIRLIPKANQMVESLFMKGYYNFLYRFLKAGYRLPGNLLCSIVDQLLSKNITTDLEMQIDILSCLPYLVYQFLSQDFPSYISKILILIIRIMHIISKIITNKPILTYQAKLGSTESETVDRSESSYEHSIVSLPPYLQLWEKLEASYRLSLTSLHNNIFARFCKKSTQAMAFIILVFGQDIKIYANELIVYFNDCFDYITEEILECIHAFISVIFLPCDQPTHLPHQKKTSSHTQSKYVPNPPFVNDFSQFSIPSWHYFLPNKINDNLPAYLSSLNGATLPNLKKPTLSPMGTYPLDNAAIFNLLKPILRNCLIKYTSHTIRLRKLIMQLLSSLFSSPLSNIDYLSIDPGSIFLDNVCSNIANYSTIFDSYPIKHDWDQAPNPITKDYHASSNAKRPLMARNESSDLHLNSGDDQDTTSANVQIYDETSLPTEHDVSHSNLLEYMTFSTTIGTENMALISELAVYELSFIYKLSLTGIKHYMLSYIDFISMAFFFSWRSQMTYDGFKDLVHLFFNENLISNFSKQAMRASPSSFNQWSQSDLNNNPNVWSTTKEYIDSVSNNNVIQHLTVFLNQFFDPVNLNKLRGKLIQELLILFPDPCATQLLTVTLEILINSIGTLNEMNINRLIQFIHEYLLVAILEDETYARFAKITISELADIFKMLDLIPLQFVNLKLVSTAFVKLIVKVLEAQKAGPNELIAAGLLDSLLPSQYTRSILDLGLTTLSFNLYSRRDSFSNDPYCKSAYDYETQLYLALDTSWLPCLLYLLRILSIFPLDEILNSLSHPLSLHFDKKMPHVEVNSNDDDHLDNKWCAKIFAQCLVMLLKKGIDFFSTMDIHLDSYSPVSPLQHEGWTRKICLLIHQIDYFFHIQTYLSTSFKLNHEPLGNLDGLIGDYYSNSTEKKLVKENVQQNDIGYFVHAIKEALLSIDLITNGAILSQCDAVAFSLCKLYQTLELTKGLESVLMISSDICMNASPSLFSKWTWYHEFLRITSFHLLCQHSIHSIHYHLREDRISLLFSDSRNLDVMIHSASSMEIKALFKILISKSHQKYHDQLLDYANNRMKSNQIDEFTSHDIYHLLLILTYLPLSTRIIGLIFDYFIQSSYISVIIACERYIKALADSFCLSFFDVAIQDMLKDSIIKHKDKLRPTFFKDMLHHKWLKIGEKIDANLLPNPIEQPSSYHQNEPLNTFDPNQNDPEMFTSLSSPSPNDGFHNLIFENWLMAYLKSWNPIHPTRRLEMACASMIHKSIFNQVIQLPYIRPNFILYFLKHKDARNVRNELLGLLRQRIRVFLNDNYLSVDVDLNTMLHQVEEANSPINSALDGHSNETNKTLIIETFAVDNMSESCSNMNTMIESNEKVATINTWQHHTKQPTAAIIHPNAWRKNFDLLRAVSLAIQSFNGDFLVSSSSLLLDSKNIMAQNTSLNNHREVEATDIDLSPASLITLTSSYSMRNLLIAYETGPFFITQFDIYIILKILKLLFTHLHFNVYQVSSHPELVCLIYRLYEIYFILFKPCNKMNLDYGHARQIPIVLLFFWNTLANVPWDEDRHFGDRLNWSPAQKEYMLVLLSLAQSSPSLELGAFPLQSDPINFDYNNNPVQLLAKICHQINTIHIRYSLTFTSVWNLLLKGINLSIKTPSVATNSMIKILTIRSMTSMLIQAGIDTIFDTNLREKLSQMMQEQEYQQDERRLNSSFLPSFVSGSLNSTTSIIANTIPFADKLDLSFGSNSFFLFLALFNFQYATLSNPPSVINHLGLNITEHIDFFLNDILKTHLVLYLQNKTHEISLGKECLKSLFLLCDFFSTPQKQWLYDTVLNVLNDQIYPPSEDPIMRMYLVTTLCKLTAYLWPTIRKSYEPKLPPVALKIQRLLQDLITQIEFQEFDIIEDRSLIPMPKLMLFLSIYYIIKAKYVFSVKDDPMIYPWLEKLPSNSPYKSILPTDHTELYSKSRNMESPMSSILASRLANLCIQTLNYQTQIADPSSPTNDNTISTFASNLIDPKQMTIKLQIFLTAINPTVLFRSGTPDSSSSKSIDSSDYDPSSSMNILSSTSDSNYLNSRLDQDGEEMNYMAEIKTLLSTARKTTVLRINNLIKNVIPSKMLHYFKLDTIISSLLTELLKPEPGMLNIALVLQEVIALIRSSKKGAALDQVLVRWVLLTLPQFTSFVGCKNTQHTHQAQSALVVIFLSASKCPILQVLFSDFISQDQKEVDKTLFVLSCVDFYRTQNLTLKEKEEFVQKVQIVQTPMFQLAANQLRIMYQFDSDRDIHQ